MTYLIHDKILYLYKYKSIFLEILFYIFLNFRNFENMTEAEEHENENQDNTKDGQKAAAALDKVTDHVEEMEMEASTASEFFWNLI